MSKHTSEADVHPPTLTKLNRALATSDASTIVAAIGETINEFNISHFAAQSGLSRQTMYRTFGGRQLPNFVTVLKVLKAMGLRLQVTRSKKSSH